MANIDVCDVELKGTALTEKDRKKLIKTMEKQLATLQKKADAEAALKATTGDPMSKNQKNELARLLEDPNQLAELKTQLAKDMKTHIEDGLEVRARQVSDLVKVQDLFEQITTDPFTGKTLRTAGEVIHTRLKRLVGRNSIDTKLRVLRNHFRNQIDHYEALFRTSENSEFKSIRDIKKGSDAERILYKKVYEMKQQMDVEKLDATTAAAMVKGKGDIDKLAHALVAYNEYTRKAMGQFGVAIKYNPDYVMKRRYDWAPMEAMGKDKWAVYMVDKLDIKKTFGDSVGRDEALKRLGFGVDNGGVWHDFEKIATERTSPLSNKDLTGGDKSSSKEVKFFWKDSDAAYASFRDLTVGGMRENFERNAMSMAGTAIQISEFGYDAKTVTAKLNSKISDSYRGKRDTIDKWRESRIESAQTELSGQQSLVQGSVTNFSNNVRFMTAFTKLGTTLATTIADAVENNRQAFYVNGDFFGGLMEWSNNMRKMVLPSIVGGHSKEEMQEIANLFGVIMSHQSNSEGLRMATGDLATNGGALTRLIQEKGGTAINIATLLPMQTGMSKLASALTGASNFSKLVDDAMAGKLNKFQKDTLNEYGFSRNEVALLGSGHVERTDTWGSRPLFTGAGVRRLLEHPGGPEHIGKLLGVDPELAGKAVVDLATKVESFVNDFTTRGTPTPELATKTLLYKNVNNEVLRAAINLTTQFMDTPLSSAENLVDLAKKLKRINTQDGKLNTIGMTGEMMGHLGVYSVAGIGMYLAADAVMSAATNSEAMIQKAYNGDSEARRNVFIKSLSKIAVVPYVAELVDNQWGGGYNKTAMDTFIGPNWGTLRDTLRLAQAKEDGGLELGKFMLRQGPVNAIPVRALNNWAEKARGNKLWDDNKGTFF